MSARNGIIRKVIIALSVTLVVALVGGISVVAWVLRRPLPNVEGTATLAGLGAEVTVIRDGLGVPQLYAATDLDLFRAQGWVHAQDRFFEMDYRRHVASGRLSELVGDLPEARDSDTVTRTMGWRRVAEQEWELLDPDYQSRVQAYADGVNAYLGRREASELGVEYTVLGLGATLADIEPWTPVDTLVWLKAVAWDLRANYDDELERASIYATVGDMGRVAELFPAYPYDQRAPIIPGDTAAVFTVPGAVDAGWDDGLREGGDAVSATIRALDAVPTLLGGAAGIGSNSFVIAGQYTESGRPILANDPHNTVGAPGIWHQIGLHCVKVTEDCTLDVSGFSLAGTPGVIIGHNADLSWGITTMGADVTDFYLERVYPEGQYQRGADRVDLQTRTEEVLVAGGEPFTVEIQSTIHGPILSEAMPSTGVAAGSPVPAESPAGDLDGYAVSLAWTALTPGRTIEAILDLARAATPADVAAAAAKYEVPAQNIIFATAAGDIGLQATGRIPIRSLTVSGAVPADGTWPRPGWDPAYDWEGFLPAENLPSTLNPSEGFIVAANQPVTVSGGGAFLTADFDYGFRAQRLRSLVIAQIEAGEKVTGEDANALMMDSAHPLAGVMVPAILRLNLEEEFVREAVRELRSWREEGYPTDVDSAGAAYFNTVWANVLALTFADELPADVSTSGDSRWIQVVTLLMDDPRNAWWDDVSTVRVTETRDEILVRAVENARYQLTNTLGKDAERWRWGDLHHARFEHPILTTARAPGVLAWITNPTPFEVSGTSAAVNATSWVASMEAGERADFTMTAAPSMRMVVDMSDLDASTWVVTTGTSGHPTSSHWADQVHAWAVGGSYPWVFSREAVEEAAVNTLTLRPAQ